MCRRRKTGYWGKMIHVFGFMITSML
jgi:hypothetical protein